MKRKVPIAGRSLAALLEPGPSVAAVLMTSLHCSFVQFVFILKTGPLKDFK